MASRRKKQSHKKKNTFAIIVTTLLLLIVTAAIALIANLMLNHRTFSDIAEEYSIGKGKEDNSEEEVQEEPEESEPEIPEEERYYFEKGQMHRGNLILVNAEYPYDFDANANLDIASIREVNIVKCAMASEDFELCGSIMTSLAVMIEDCNEAIGYEDTGISSAYRSYEYQQKVYDETAKQYGKEYADKYVAVPGYSEHHTGLALDMGIYRFDGYVGTFSESNNAKWIDNNCQLYGFVRRYKEDKVSITGISNEAWHFRYVGVPHATYMNEHNLCLEEYIDYLKTRTIDMPLVVACNNGSYRIWYTQDEYIREPENPFEVSGNNVDGYIITETLIA
ncbi:MAG: M15 family metallopeptidase [Lachnospiraceae bacterium]|nr:M15 family metallopeptidase [Lachnospiraceae bacterium]